MNLKIKKRVAGTPNPYDNIKTIPYRTYSREKKYLSNITLLLKNDNI
jgi:hypothetical protein